MSELIQASSQYPTVLLTIVVGIAIVYWLFVILGALDLDILGGADAELGGGEVGDAGDAGDVGDGASTFLTGLGIRKVPLTISLTTIAVIAWVISLLGVHYLADNFSGVIAIGMRSGIFLVSLVAGLLLASLVVRPLAPFFKTHSARSRVHYVGSTCTVDTGTVDNGFGQARIEDGGDVLVIAIRCDSDNSLKKGAQALVIDYDNAREAYLVEQMDSLVTDKKE